MLEPPERFPLPVAESAGFPDASGRCDTCSAADRTNVEWLLQVRPRIGSSRPNRANRVRGCPVVVNHGLYVAQTCFEFRLRWSATSATAISVTSPHQPGIGEVCIGRPASFIDERLQSGTVGARHRAKYTIACPRYGSFGVNSGLREGLRLCANVVRKRVVFLGFVKFSNGSHGRVKKVDLGWKCVTEEA